MPNYQGTFDTGETLTLWALNIEDAADEMYAQMGYHPDEVQEVM